VSYLKIVTLSYQLVKIDKEDTSDTYFLNSYLLNQTISFEICANHQKKVSSRKIGLYICIYNFYYTDFAK